MEDAEATEADKIRILGITFRSGSHLYWFTLSMFLTGVLIRMRLQGAGPSFFGGTVLAFHGYTVAIAAWRTRWGRINGRVYSRDCIWFNALMWAVDWCIIHAYR